MQKNSFGFDILETCLLPKENLNRFVVKNGMEQSIWGRFLEWALTTEGI